MSNKALIIVDYQEDFLPGGALGVADGLQAYLPLMRLMDDVDLIVFTRDWHPPDHMSFYERGLPNRMINDAMEAGLWPPHCVQNTDGAAIDSDLWEAAIDTDKLVILVNKGDDPDKEAYSGFQGYVANVFNSENNLINALVGATLPQALTYLGVREVKIGGLALDYCVKATAIDSRSHYGNTTVYLAATRPVAYLTGTAAVAELAAKGVRLDTRELA